MRQSALLRVALLGGASLRASLPVLVCALATRSYGSTGGSTVLIDEILYSSKPGGPDMEFIELYNPCAEPIDLSNFFFAKGLSFVFPYPTFVKGNGFVVVAADPDALKKDNPLLQSDEPKFPRVVGPFDSGKLDDSGETIALANPAGAIVAEVKYNNRGAWPAEADKTGHSIVLKDVTLDPEEAKSWKRSPQIGGSPGFANFGQKVFTKTTILPEGASWKYLKGLKALETDPDPPSVPVEAWRQVGFDDAAWLEGPAPIGFESTAQPAFATRLDDMLNTYISVFFRKEFEVASKDGMDKLVLKLGFDDGFVAYLNGVEVARKNVRVGEETYADKASGPGETKVGDARDEFDITAAVASTLVVGKNVLAVQVHNSTINSNDFGFAPSLHYVTESFVGAFTETPVRVNELYSSDPAERWLELYNESDTPVDLSGFHLTDDALKLDKYTIPAGKTIAARSWMVFTQEDLAASGIRLVVADGKKSLWIGLSTPDLKQVVDAYAFQPPSAPGLSDARFPDGDRTWVVSRSPTRGAANAFEVERDVVINEIMYNPYHPFGDFADAGSIYKKPEDQGEYVELYNRSDRTISLGGWRFNDAIDYEFASDASIGPHEYLVIAKDPDWLASHYGLERAKVLGPFYNLRKKDENGQTVYVPDVTGGFFENDSGKLELLDELGNETNQVRYADSGQWPIWADGRGSSLELIDPFQDNSQPMAWDASDESSKAQWKHYSYVGRMVGQAELKFMLLTPGIVLIDNLSVKDNTNPAAQNTVAFGTFEAPLKSTDVLFGGTHAWSGIVQGDAKDGQGALRIVSTGRGNNRADRIEINTFSPAPPLSKDLLIEFDAKWVAGEGVLLTAAYNHTCAQSHFIEVPTKLGSPGRENSVHARLPSGSLGPIISGVRHDPPLPAPSAPVTVRARVTDSDGVASVQLHWKLDGTPSETATIADMLDDGAHGDGAAGDGVYGAEVPGQAALKVVVFWITGQDGKGNLSRFPVRETERTAPMRIDPSNLSPTARAAPPTHDLVYQHSAYQPDLVRSYRMVFSKENWSYLTSRPVMSNDLVDSTFVYNDSAAYYNVGIRFGNSPWTRPSYGPSNASYRAKFGKDNEFQGWRKFKLDNQRNENYMDESMAWYLFRSNASATPGGSSVYLEHLYCQPYVCTNGSAQKLVHIFDHVEVPGKPFLAKWWPGDSDGTLFKLDDRFEVDDNGNRVDSIEARLIYPPAAPGNSTDGTQKENYRWFFLHRQRDKFDNFSEIMDVAKLLDSRRTNAETFNAELFKALNMEEMVRDWAISINLDDWDTWGTTRGKNCFIYRPRADGRWNHIPWDKDLIFGNVSQLPLVPSNHAEVARVLSSPNGKRLYNNVIQQMLDTFYNATYVGNFFSEVAKTAPVGQIGTYTRGTAFLTARTPTMKSALGAKPANFEITSPAQEQVSQPQSTVVVKGSAPYGVWFLILQQGSADPRILYPEEGDVTWNGTVWTTKAIDLADGSNTLTFFGYGMDGNELIGQDSVTVFVGVPQFVRGDANGDGKVDLTDAIVILNHLFKGETVPACHDRLDADDTGVVDLTDAIYMLRYLFQGGPEIPAPYPDPGTDPTPDDLVDC